MLSDPAIPLSPPAVGCGAEGWTLPVEALSSASGVKIIHFNGLRCVSLNLSAWASPAPMQAPEHLAAHRSEWDTA